MRIVVCYQIWKQQCEKVCVHVRVHVCFVLTCRNLSPCFYSQLLLDAYRQATFTTCGYASWDTYFYYYPGVMSSSTTGCTGVDDSCGLQSSISTDVSASVRTVSLFMTGYSSYTGTYQLSIQCTYSKFLFGRLRY